MELTLYQVDAFTDELFGGNPAAVCPLQEWLPDEVMQNIAAENNLAETAFYVPTGRYFELRWFTPAVEVDLCGHATLATAHVLFEHEGFEGDTIVFQSPRSGELRVQKEGEELTLNFPADAIAPTALTDELKECFNIAPQAAIRGKTDVALVFESEDDILQLAPNLRHIARIDARGMIATAPGKEVDFVCRFFGPQVGIDEDPVTGSAYTTLTPYWADRLGKNELSAAQRSRRGGQIRCTYLGDRIGISGRAVRYLKGSVFI
ncbi:PhzF family phenazine biosynthesis protein [Cryomorphaceae bacterium]|nr:PhzF family phenazine biosynthesis protein [Cryomorphaceae bacterium]